MSGIVAGGHRGWHYDPLPVVHCATCCRQLICNARRTGQNRLRHIALTSEAIFTNLDWVSAQTSYLEKESRRVELLDYACLDKAVRESDDDRASGNREFARFFLQPALPDKRVVERSGLYRT